MSDTKILNYNNYKELHNITKYYNTQIIVTIIIMFLAVNA